MTPEIPIIKTVGKPVLILPDPEKLKGRRFTIHNTHPTNSITVIAPQKFSMTSPEIPFTLNGTSGTLSQPHGAGDIFHIMSNNRYLGQLYRGQSKGVYSWLTDSKLDAGMLGKVVEEWRKNG